MEQELRDILNEALTDIRGVGAAARQKLVDKYAPALAQIQQATSQQEAKEMFDDVMVNVRTAAHVAGIKAESVAAEAVVKWLTAFAKFALAAVAV